MNVFQALILGIVQGLTEFIPVSSSGHLVLLPRLLGWEPQSLVFDTTVHLGTALALIIYFSKDLWNIVVRERALGLKILVGTIPAAVVGYVWGDFFEIGFRSMFSVAVFLFLGSALILVAERYFKAPLKGSITYVKGLIVGMFQVLAFFPGVSRSGATISGGMLVGLRHRDAARFSFLLSVPIVLMAGVYKLMAASAEGVYLDATLLVGFVASFVSGLGAISFLMNFLKRQRLYVFAAYRLCLVIALIVVLSS